MTKVKKLKVLCLLLSSN